jgi:hypothetical protein
VLFKVKTQVDENGKSKTSWMKPGVGYPVYHVYNRTEKTDQSPFGYKFVVWFLICNPEDGRIAMVMASGVDYVGE